MDLENKNNLLKQKNQNVVKEHESTLEELKKFSK
jgi:hypothetical protein